MKKTLIALAVLSAITGAAHAQSNITIYGILDIGYVKETGKSMRMDEFWNNRFGFRGEEDMGNGLKATFQLEKRFKLYDGSDNVYRTGGVNADNTPKTGTGFDGGATVGLTSKDWGAVRFGRMWEMTSDTYLWKDPFYQLGIASSIYSSLRSPRVSNMVRYDTPNINGFALGASYALGQNSSELDKATGNSNVSNPGYAFMSKYDNGPVSLLANWTRAVDSDNSTFWNLSGAYNFGKVTTILGFQKTRDNGYLNGAINPATRGGADGSRQDQWLLGLQWKLGPGEMQASFNQAKVKDVKGWNDSAKMKKYALGYTCHLSKRTSLYVQAAYSTFSDLEVAQFYRGSDKKDDDSITAYTIGMTHKF